MMGEQRVKTELAAKHLNVSTKTVRRKARALGGKKIPGGRDWLFLISELDKRLVN